MPPPSFIPTVPLLLYLLVSFTFFFFLFLLVLSIFWLSVPSHSTRIVPLHLQALCRRWQLNLDLVLLCWFYVICIF